MISFSNYINITSGVGAGAGVRRREFILRMITNSTVLPPGIVAEFSTSDSVAAYFGANSEEAKRAKRYFSFVSKATRSPAKVSFSRFIAAAIAPTVVGDASVKSLTALKLITAGVLTFGIETVTGGASAEAQTAAIDLSAVADLTAAATVIQTAVRAVAGQTALTTATVTYNSNTNQFVLTGSTTGSGRITVKSSSTTDLAALLGWASDSTVYAPGQAADTPETAVTKSAAISSNFGSFLFVPRLKSATAPDQQLIADVAEWNHAQNNRYMFLQGVLPANAAALFDACKGFSGMATVINREGNLEDYADQFPAEVFAATDFSRPAANQNYMYQQSGSRYAAVTDDTAQKSMDAVRANYFGATEKAGQIISFFQRGVLMGDSTAAVDMNIYANECWFKDEIGSEFMELLLNVPAVPTNVDGRAMVLSVLTTASDTAKANGVISVGKTLTNIQRQYVTQLTGQNNAWRQVQDSGAYYNVEFKSEVTADGRTEWRADYIMVYAKGDAIRKVTGSNTLI